MTEFKIDWSSIIVDIVKKKDLDSYEFADCWTEDYDWTKLDLFVIGSYEDEVVQWGLTAIEIENKGQYKDLTHWTEKEVAKDLMAYRTKLEAEQ